MRISGKKLMAIVLSVTMLVSCMVFSFSASAASKLLWQNYFDNASATNWASAYKTDGTSTSYDNSNRSAQTAYPVANGGVGDSGAMKLSLISTGYAAGFRIYADHNTQDEHGAESDWTTTKAEQGKFKPRAYPYVICFAYKVLSTDVSIDIYADINSYLWSGDKTETATAVKVATVTPADARVGEWVYVSAQFMGKHSANGAHIMALSSDSSVQANAQILIDNIEVVNHSSSDASYTVTYMLGDRVVGTSAPGRALSYAETPALDVAIPAGYAPEIYSDAALTQKLDVVRYGTANSTVYLKLPAVEGAETVSRTWSVEDVAVGTDVDPYGTKVAVSETTAHSGSRALRANLNDRSGSGRAQFYVCDASGSQVNVEAGKGYIVSFYMYVSDEGANQTTHLNLWMYAANGTQSRPSDSTLCLFDDYTSESKAVTTTDGWVKITRYIPAAAASGKLLLGITCTGASSSANDVVYLDDFTVTCVDDIAFYAGNSDREQYLFEGTAANGKATNLHYSTANKEDKGLYTSIRLGATYTSADATGATVYIGGVAYDIAERGLIVGTKGMSLTADGAQGTDYKWKSSKASGFDSVWEKSGNKLTYTLRLANMSEAWFESDTEYQYRSYYVIKVPYIVEKSTTVETLTYTVYGNVSDAFTFAELYGDFESAGKVSQWFPSES